jgi:myo-inositol 2-dehydrogenase/D-chiro-inositol 1-dehydrogenase/scyllo-inositol 2-dehydrogenase (NAD+)
VDTLRFAVIGTGRAGLIHARNLAWRIPNVALAAICDPDAQTLAAVGGALGVAGRYAEYREALDRSDIDAVVVVTPTFLHREIACAAAQQGKHVFLEKPMAVTAAECHEILAAVDQAGVKLQIGFMRRFDDGFLGVKEVLDSGELGQVMKVKSTGRGPGLPPPWIYDLTKSNGIIAEVNSHDLDSLRWLTGSEPVRVYAEGGNFKCPEARRQFPDFYDNVLACFRFADGALGEVDGTCPCHYGYDARVEVLCEAGMLQVGSVAQPGVTRVSVDGQVAGQAVKSWRNLFKDAYLAEMEHFVDCIRLNEPPRVTGLDGLRAVEMVVAVNASLRSGRPVEIPGGGVS